MKEEVTEGALSTLEDMLAGVISQTTEVEEEFKSEQNIEKQVGNRSLKHSQRLTLQFSKRIVCVHVSISQESNMKMTELSGTSASAGPAGAD